MPTATIQMESATMSHTELEDTVPARRSRWSATQAHPASDHGLTTTDPEGEWR